MSARVGELKMRAPPPSRRELEQDRELEPSQVGSPPENPVTRLLPRVPSQSELPERAPQQETPLSAAREPEQRQN